MKYQNLKKAIVLLEDGTIFHGKSVESEGTVFGEVCFNTGATGYQEVFTDPSYYGQLMVAANVNIGNYGVSVDEVESDAVQISGLICKNFSYTHSRSGAVDSLQSYLKANGLLAISEVDTRALVSYIRDHGAMNAAITTDIENLDLIKRQLSELPSMSGLELVSKVSTKEAYYYGNENATYKVAVLDLGVKRNILKELSNRDVYLKVFPYTATFEDMSSFEPNGYMLSNGPGDPSPLIEAQTLAKEIIARNLPLFGICLGHQTIALANGIPTYKMHNGHRGINHPVKNLLTGKGEITSQNHGFAIDREATEKHPDITISHVHLNDHTVAGIQMKSKKCFSVQFHPEASPGPHDSKYLFDQFIDYFKA